MAQLTVFILLGLLSSFDGSVSMKILNYTNVPCGTVDQLTTVKLGQQTGFPWSVAIKTHSEDAPRCMGTILNQRAVLLPAHCLCNEKNQHLSGKHFVGFIEAEINKDNLNTGIVDFKTAQIYNPHSCKQPYHGDYALLQTTSKIRWSAAVTPACLIDFDEAELKFKNSQSVVWDQTAKRAKSGSKALKKLKYQVTGGGKCGATKLTKEFDTKLLICADTPKGVDECEGIVGSPLVIQEQGVFGVVGLSLEADRNCTRTGNPRKFTSVGRKGQIVSWITDVIKDWEKID